MAFFSKPEQLKPAEQTTSMAEFRRELEGLALVFLGNFNPSIFQPAWLAHQKLIRQEEADSATIEIIRPEISLFTVGTIKLVVQPERFQMETAAAEDGPAMRDLASGIFRILEHTPITAVGINRDMHFRMSVEDWHKVGHRVVPKEIWDGLIDGPGTRSVTLESSSDPKDGRLTIKLEPSLRIQPGVYIGTNLHFERQGHEAVDTLQAKWIEAQNTAKSLAETILTKCIG